MLKIPLSLAALFALLCAALFFRPSVVTEAHAVPARVTTQHIQPVVPLWGVEGATATGQRVE